MPALQVRATQLRDASAKELEQLRVRARELRLRTSDLQAREQQLRESRFQTPVGPDRVAADRQWLNVRHDMTAATLELEGVNERMNELRVQRDQAAREQTAREQAASVATVVSPGAPERPVVETTWLANAGTMILILFMAPVVLVLVYRLFTRNGSRDTNVLDSSARFQRMEQVIESIAMDVERLAEGQRFTTRILAERHPDSASRAQVAAAEETDRIVPH